MDHARRSAVILLAPLMGLALIAAPVVAADAADATITLHADQPLPRTAGPLRSGVCLEDVNHEVYGGIYSQMVFGESFQEPALSTGPKDFHVYGGSWRIANGAIAVDGTDGPKCISDLPAFGDGTVSVQMRFDNPDGENAGLLLRTSHARTGADAFTGYEVSVSPARQTVRIARHRDDYHLLKDVPAAIPVGKWFTLEVSLKGGAVAVRVAGREVASVVDDAPPSEGSVGLRAWNEKASFRTLTIDRGNGPAEVPIVAATDAVGQVSGMWRPIVSGGAVPAFSLPSDGAFVGAQSQRVAFSSGTGAVGIENRGLNRQGMSFVAGKPYEGVLWAKVETASRVTVAMESADGSKAYAERDLNVAPGDWRKLEFQLTPSGDDAAGRFAIKLKQLGVVTIGYALLQPGSWGRFADLPVRRDVVQGLIDQRVGVIRYGGSMVNDDHYRWKRMVGPRDRRQPYQGHWYSYSTNGWGVFDFLNLTEAMGIEGIPDLGVNETPQDVADFVEYVNGSADSEWGARRAADGHPAPYHLKHLELGNEERVDAAYARKFNALAGAIWAKDREITPIVGDFAYRSPITDPDHVTRADSGIGNMDGHRSILRFAKAHDRAVWFDVHVWSEGLQPSDNLRTLPSYIDALDRIADGAKHRALVFELNANSHGMRRALANATSVNAIRRDGRLPIVVSANALQVDRQNDNGWDQGLLFLNPGGVWLQPPGLVTKMQAGDLSDGLIRVDVTGAPIDVTASEAADGRSVTIQVVNPGDAVSATIDLGAFQPVKPEAEVTEMSGDLRAFNTAGDPNAVALKRGGWKIAGGKRTFAAHSLAVLRIE